MKVWIGCLSCYNDGVLTGGWYDAGEAAGVSTKVLHAAEGIVTDDEGCVVGEEIYGPHEELWVMDTDETPHESLAREMSPSEAAEIAGVLDELERAGVDLEPFGAFVDSQGLPFDVSAVGEFEESFQGVHDSERDFAYQFADGIGAVPADLGWPLSCIDWEQATRELFMEYWSVPAAGGGVYVFWSM